MIQVSIITINFNNCEDLKRTFESISKFKKSNFEYIVIDADSNDGSRDLIKRYQTLIDVQVIEKDKGIYDGMNKGIALANGAYILFINSGDELESDEIFAFMKSSEKLADVVYGDTKINYENGYERVAKALDISELWKSLPFIHQSVLVKTAILKENLFNLNYKYCSDYELFCRLKSLACSFQKVSICISKIEAGGVSDLKRELATTEVYEISSSYMQLDENQKNYFKKEIKKGRRIQSIKKIIPKSLVKLGLKIKYRK